MNDTISETAMAAAAKAAVDAASVKTEGGVVKIIGVPEDKIELKKPEGIKVGATSAEEGRRVEVTLM